MMMFAQAIELSLKGQVTFWKLCLLVVFMALIKSRIRFFHYNNCFQAEKCIYIPVLASTISNRVSLLVFTYFFHRSEIGKFLIHKYYAHAVISDFTSLLKNRDPLFLLMKAEQIYRT